MKVTPTAVLTIAGLGVAAFVGWRVYKGAGSVASAAADALNAVNPLNHDNVIATTVNDVGGSIVTSPTGPGKNADGSWSLGGFIFDLVHPNAPTWGVFDEPPTPPGPTPPSTWSTAGQWNNPSAYTTPGVTGSGGAAFGVYPGAF